ncbi:MAG TPA: hybrid sensor histidine kinase/response regulator [Anaerolineae bacterium]
MTVDDSATIRVFVKSLLRARDAAVEEASTGKEALELCKGERRYDLILLDLLLPDMDGIQVLRCLRETDQETAIVMLTGMGGVKSAMAAVRLGADGYIEKHDLSIDGDATEFFFGLEQAMQHRAGLVAIQQLERVKADFYSMVTHDLRNPAATILLATGFMLDGEAGPMTEQMTEFLLMVRAAAQKLQHLITDYLDFAKIDAGFLRLHLKEEDLREIVRSSARLTSVQIRARQQSIDLQLPGEPVQARVDAERLKQVLDNLLSNAVKYTPIGGHIRASLSVSGDQAVLSVSDDGPGIPPQHLSALFTKYHRVPEAATQTVAGTGLGLLIVKEIVEAHGGRVRADSAGIPGQGATFTVFLPLAR